MPAYVHECARCTGLGGSTKLQALSAAEGEWAAGFSLPGGLPCLLCPLPRPFLDLNLKKKKKSPDPRWLQAMEGMG